MQNSIYIDANIILDLLDNKRASFEDSKKLIEYALFNGLDLAISDDIITTIYYIARKSIAREKLLKFIEFINKNFEILPFNKDVITIAIDIALKNSSYDFEDTLQAVCALENGYSLIITNDNNLPKIDGLKILSSSEFLELVKDE